MLPVSGLFSGEPLHYKTAFCHYRKWYKAGARWGCWIRQLSNNRSKIEVFFIPPYSPELNPQEYVDQDLKTNIIGKKRTINKDRLRENISGFMNKRKKDRPQVKKYFHHRHAQYAA